MKNTWIIPRNKRKLTPVVEILSAFHLGALNEQWSGERERQVKLETTLEEFGIKRVGHRRDQGGSGARTYEAWLACLGLIFTETVTGLQRLTIAGEMLLNGAAPKLIITDQLMKFQYPSSYSMRQQVQVSERFHLHPFRFMLSLLQDTDIECLTQEEVALFVITEGDSDSDKCLKHVAERIKDFRTSGLKILDSDFCKLYPARTGVQSFEDTLNRLNDLANTFINFLEYTQLAVRDADKMLRIIKPLEVKHHLEKPVVFIEQPENEEYFQRKYGLAGGKTKDTRSFGLSSVSSLQIQEKLIETFFLSTATKDLVTTKDPNLVEFISERTGCSNDLVAEKISEYHGREVGIFESEYFRMALAGREQSAEFEQATAQLFGEKGLGFKAEHTGKQRLQPDVYIISLAEGFSGIIDNKAYAAYSISNDHKNRMLHNYLPYYKGKDGHKFNFFLYIAGGFKSTFDVQVKDICYQAKISGSGINASNVIKLLDAYKSSNLKHRDLKKLFMLEREAKWKDIAGL